jgi:hypothetical protein
MAKQTIIFSPPDLMQAALTKVNENFTELYSNPETNQSTQEANDPVDPLVFTVSDSVEVYFIKCTLNDVTANFDLSTYGRKKVTFIRTDNTAFKFYINDISGTFTVSGESVPFDTGSVGMTQYRAISVVSDGSNLFIF